MHKIPNTEITDGSLKGSILWIKRNHLQMRTVVFVLYLLIALAVSRDTCLSYDSIVDSASMDSFDPQLNQGEWYVVSTNDPIEPKFCKCDVFNWQITSNTSFSDKLTTQCPFKIHTKVTGTLSTDPDRPGLFKAGSPPFFPMISNSVVYVEGDGYQVSIRYSCEENLGKSLPSYKGKLFEYVQILSRQKVLPQEDVERLVAKAASLGILENIPVSNLRNSTFEGCSSH